MAKNFIFSPARTAAMFNFIGVAHFINIPLIIFYYAIDCAIDYALLSAIYSANAFKIFLTRMHEYLH